MDHHFEIDNCPSMMIYNKQTNRETNEIIYYMLFICTKFKFKNQGYASQLLDDFIHKIREKHANNNENNENEKKITSKIVLSSLWNAATFYESYGFNWARHDTILNHPVLLKHEKYEEDKEYIIMELVL
jgi:ribosomal protein S18 acetylase RimI-like enzyme